MTAFATHYLFAFRSGIRDRNALFMMYIFPLGIYLLMAAILPSINPMFGDALIPAMITFAILGATLLGLPDGVINGREKGIFRSYKINGVPAFSILAIPILTTMLHLTVVVIIIAVSAILVFNAPAPVSWPGLMLVFVAGTLASAGLAVLSGVVASDTRVGVLLGQALFLPSMIIGGIMLPASMLPPAAATAAQLLPSTHIMNAFNGLAMGVAPESDPWLSVGLLFTGGLLAFALALFLFRWDRQSNGQPRGRSLLALLALAPYVAAIVF